VTNDRFLRACRREPVDKTPVWFMRQAGRYMPEYRALREKHSLLELVRTPELAAEVTLQPIRALPLDAAILFSDLLVPLAPLGIPFDFQKGEGPVIEKPVRSAADVAALRRFEPRDELRAGLETIRLLRRELRVPLIGFAGAPFTLASYAIEGGGSRHFAKTKDLMYRDPATWHRLAGLLADVVADYLRAQVEAGAQALQLFDSWVGALDEADYRELVQPHVRRIFDALADLDVPLIHFGTGTGPPAGRPARRGRQRDRRRLAHAARRGPAPRRRRRGAPGQPGPDAPVRAAGAPARARRRRAAAGGRPSRPRLQPRPRDPAGDARRGCARRHRARPRAN
jgi:uroporphyrinogen decarboxylase